VLWPIVYSVTADDLETLQRRSTTGLQDHGLPGGEFAADEINASAPRVTDRHAQA